MTLKRYKAFTITLASALILFITGLLCFPLYSFLSPNILPDSADVLVVEGWLQKEALDKAKVEFQKNNYKLLITTGFPYNDGFRMGSGGIAQFNVQNQVKPASESIYTIIITIRGTQVNDVYSHVILYADTSRFGDCYSTRRKKEHTFIVKLNVPPKSIVLNFDNDAYTNNQDRDLYLYSVRVNDCILHADNPQVALYDDWNDPDSFIRFLGHSTAIDAANYLISIGIPDSLIVPIETQGKAMSKTYASAIDVRQHFVETVHSDKRSITVLSKGIHSRRSYYSYKKAFGSSVCVGVISISDESITRFNWWKSLKGWSTVLYELGGIFYVAVFC